MRRTAPRQPAPKPDKALYADFLAALVRVTVHGETVTVHGYTVSWPTRPTAARGGDYRLNVRAPRSLRVADSLKLEIVTVVGERSGDARNIKKQAAVMAFDLMADRALRAQIAADFDAEQAVYRDISTRNASAFRSGAGRLTPPSPR